MALFIGPFWVLLCIFWLNLVVFWGNSWFSVWCWGFAIIYVQFLNSLIVLQCYQMCHLKCYGVSFYLLLFGWAVVSQVLDLSNSTRKLASVRVWTNYIYNQADWERPTPKMLLKPDKKSPFKDVLLKSNFLFMLDLGSSWFGCLHSAQADRQNFYPILTST